MKNNCRVELLESRIAPAAIFVSATTATYTDVDGDMVTVKFGKPILTANPGGNIDSVLVESGGQLQLIDLTGVGAAAAGTSITVTAKVAGNGDGFANVGYIKATGIDLGSVSIHGDLGRLDAGDANLANGVKSLTVTSMGLLGTTTQQNAPAPNLNSTINGPLGALVISTVLNQAHLETTGAAAGIGSVFIGGDLVGGAATNSGGIKAAGAIPKIVVLGDFVGAGGDNSGGIQADSIGAASIAGSLLGGAGSSSGGLQTTKSLGAVTIGRNIIGGNVGSNSGGILAGTTLGKATVGGSVRGGAAPFSGGIEGTASLGSVKVAGDVTGGVANFSGAIGSYGAVGDVTIGGSLIGPTVTDSSASPISVAITGEIVGLGSVKSVTILGDVIGGSVNGTANLSDAGYVSGGTIGKVTINGSVIAGHDNSSGALVNSGAIRAITTLGTVTIGGNLAGASGSSGFTPAEISAGGAAVAPASGKADLAIGKLTIGGNVDHANILAGVPRLVLSIGVSSGANADAQIGSITVFGNWIASNAVAGAQPTNAFFGDGDDAKISGGVTRDNPANFSKIAALTIAGQVLGTDATVNGADSFGFDAQQFGTVKIGGASITIGAPLRHIGATGDVAFEVIPSP